MFLTGQIFDIQRFSIHDGPGIRTTVFFKGCPLQCIWCHNPEGISRQPQLSFMPDKCIGCGWCFRTCPQGAHAMDGEAHVLDRAVCAACGRCAERCHAGALEIIGRDVTVEEVLDEVRRDAPFYETSGGGMTLSGGEPLMQPAFAEALLTAAKAEGIHCVMETCGQAVWSQFEKVRGLVDIFLFDIKETDPGRHEACVGTGNEIILSNLRKLSEAGSAIVVRLPIVPGLNDREDHFRKVETIVQSLAPVPDVEVIPYHRLGTSKQARLGIAAGEGDIGVVEAPSREQVAEWVRVLRSLGLTVLNEV